MRMLPKLICLDKKYKSISVVILTTFIFTQQNKLKSSSSVCGLQMEMVLIDEDDHVIDKDP